MAGLDMDRPWVYKLAWYKLINQREVTCHCTRLLLDSDGVGPNAFKQVNCCRENQEVPNQPYLMRNGQALGQMICNPLDRRLGAVPDRFIQARRKPTGMRCSFTASCCPGTHVPNRWAIAMKNALRQDCDLTTLGPVK